MKNILLLLLVILTTACSVTTSRQHPDLDNALTKVETVAILPPRVEVHFVTLTGENERMTEKEAVIREEIISKAQAALDSRGFEVVEYDFDTHIQSDPDFAYSVTQVRSEFDRLKAELQHGRGLSPEEANQFKVSIGEMVNEVSAISGADAILIVSHEGWEKSGGQISKDIGKSLMIGVLTLGAVVPVYATSSSVLEAALIDGVTGDVLWTDVKIQPESQMDTVMKTLPNDVDPIASASNDVVAMPVQASP